MKRMLVQFDEETHRHLRQEAFRQHRSISSLVRELVAKGLDADVGRPRPTRVTEFASVRAGRSKQGRLAAVSEKHDQALASTFRK